jgi:hypothetical protein
MKWITCEKIKVDRVACPWLIRNFFDSETEFVFLPRETEWERIDNGTVFDVPNYELGHHGEDVSFNSILKKCNLTEPALVLLGRSSARLIRVPPLRTPRAKVCAGSQAGSGLLDYQTTKFSSVRLLFTTRFTRNANAGSTSVDGLAMGNLPSPKYVLAPPFWRRIAQ